jgi:hypothetical protein
MIISHPNDTDKYYQLVIEPGEEIQISENDLTTDSDRHRSLSRHRRVSNSLISSGSAPLWTEGAYFLVGNTSIFDRHWSSGDDIK